MDALEKKVLKTACNNLRRATEIPRNFADLNAYKHWIDTANRSAIDLTNIVDTLMNDDSDETAGPDSPIKL